MLKTALTQQEQPPGPTSSLELLSVVHKSTRYGTLRACGGGYTIHVVNSWPPTEHWHIGRHVIVARARHLDASPRAHSLPHDIGEMYTRVKHTGGGARARITRRVRAV